MADLFDIVELEAKDIDTLCTLAYEIWHEHFPAIIGEDATDYMLKTFQSPGPIREQMASGVTYCFLTPHDEGDRVAPVGYFAYKCREDDLFLSKLYIRADQRGKRGSRQVLDYLVRLARERGCASIRLDCNQHNSGSIAAYEHLGFVIEKSMVTDMGSGVLMDDYGFRYDIPEIPKSAC